MCRNRAIGVMINPKEKNNIADGTFCHDNQIYDKKNDQMHDSDLYFCNRKARNKLIFIFIHFQTHLVLTVFLTKIHITVMRLIIFSYHISKEK